MAGISVDTETSGETDAALLLCGRCNTVQPTHDSENCRHIGLCYRLSGWTQQEIRELVDSQIVPDHWWQKPDANFALLETIRIAISNKAQSISLRDNFQKVLVALNLKIPNHFGNFLRNIKTKTWNLTKANNTIGLSFEVPEVKTCNKQIGQCCESAGITVAWLENSPSVSTAVVTNEMAVEITRYKSKNNMSWNELSDLWPRFFPGEKKPDRGLVRRKLLGVVKQREKVRKKGKEALSTWLQLPFHNTGPHVEQEGPQVGECSIPFRNIDKHESDKEDESDIDNDDEWIPPLNKEDWEQYQFLQLEEVKNLETCLKNSERNMKELVAQIQKIEKLNKKLESQRDRFKYELLDIKQERDAMRRQCKTINAENEQLHSKLSNLSLKNVNRRIQSREKVIETLKKSNEELKTEIHKSEKRNNSLFHEKRKFQEKCRRYEKKFEDLQEGSTKIKQLQRELKEKNATIAELEALTDKVMTDEEQIVSTFENGHYSKDIRLTIYELLSMGVGSKKVSQIIKTVLERVGKLKVERLPKATIIKYMATEQGMLAKQAAHHAISSCEDNITLHTDGTSKKRQHFLTYLASTSEQTVALGLDDIHSETSDIMLQKAEEALKSLSDLLLYNSTEKHEDMEKMLVKIKNTMTDRAAVNKAFVRKFGQWREEVLPKVLPQWQQLSKAAQDDLIKINDLYCGKHLVLNLQEYAQSALYEWEKVESDIEKLGREKHIVWNRGTESATMLAIRSVCNCFGPDADPQHGYSFEFNVHLEDQFQDKSHLKEFRGNRFNIPFENATAVYHHIPHIKSLIGAFQESDRNRLMKSCLWDLDDSYIVAGMRAMALLEKQVTSPLMDMLDSNLEVVDTSSYYTRTFEKIKQFMVDPTELMHGQTLLFENFPPIKDKQWDSLFQPVSAELEDLTRQALIIISHSLCLCIQRQLEDHLPSGKYHNASEQVRKETKSCPKHNLAPEYLFSHLDRKKREMPNANTITIEGLILWSMNNTLKYLDSLDETNSENLIANARISRKQIIELYRQRRNKIRQHTAKKLRAMEQSQKAREVKKMEDTQKYTEKASEYILCKKVEDISSLKNCVKRSNVNSTEEELSKKIQEALKSQIRFYKSVNISRKIDYKLFHLSHGKQPLSTLELTDNLTKILQYYQDEEETTSSECQSSENEDEKKRKREQLKRKYTYQGKSPTKKKKLDPFPGNNIVSKRISMKFLGQGKRHHFYKGVVVRKSSQLDIEEYIEEEDRQYIGQMDFYMVKFDAPHHELLYCYPLEKEWKEECLFLI